MFNIVEQADIYLPHPNKYQEDAKPTIFTGNRYFSMAVFDGLGGAGSLRNHHLTEACIAANQAKRLFDYINHNADQNLQYPLTSLMQNFRSYFISTCKKFLDTSPSLPALKGTIIKRYPTTIASIVGDHKTGKITSFWLGDSRIYGIYENQIVPLSKDHVKDNHSFFNTKSIPLSHYLNLSETKDLEFLEIEGLSSKYGWGQLLGIFVCTDGAYDRFNHIFEFYDFMITTLKSAPKNQLEPHLTKHLKNLNLQDDTSLALIFFDEHWRQKLPPLNLQKKNNDHSTAEQVKNIYDNIYDFEMFRQILSKNSNNAYFSELRRKGNVKYKDHYIKAIEYILPFIIKKLNDSPPNVYTSLLIEQLDKTNQTLNQLKKQSNLSLSNEEILEKYNEYEKKYLVHFANQKQLNLHSKNGVLMPFKKIGDIVSFSDGRSTKSYTLIANPHNDKSGTAMWTFATKSTVPGKEFFIKNFLAPKAPSALCDATEFERRKVACQNFIDLKNCIFDRLKKTSIVNIVKPEDFFQADNSFFVTYEKINGHHINFEDERNDFFVLPIEEKIEVLRQIVNSVLVLTDDSIVHADIKSNNLMFTKRDHKLIPYLIDFDSAYISNKPPFEIISDFLYQSPETLEYNLSKPEIGVTDNRVKENLNVKSDVFSLGVLLYFMLNRKYVKDNTTGQYAAQMVLNKKPIVLDFESSGLTAKYAKKLKGIIEEMLKPLADRSNLIDVLKQLENFFKKEDIKITKEDFNELIKKIDLVNDENFIVYHLKDNGAGYYVLNPKITAAQEIQFRKILDSYNVTIVDHMINIETFKSPPVSKLKSFVPKTASYEADDYKSKITKTDEISISIKTNNRYHPSDYGLKVSPAEKDKLPVEASSLKSTFKK